MSTGSKYIVLQGSSSHVFHENLVIVHGNLERRGPRPILQLHLAPQQEGGGAQEVDGRRDVEHQLPLWLHALQNTQHDVVQIVQCLITGKFVYCVNGQRPIHMYVHIITYIYILNKHIIIIVYTGINNETLVYA